MKKNLLFVAGICLTAVLLVCWFTQQDARRSKTYSSAKILCEDYLRQHGEALEEIAVKLAESEKEGSGYYRNRYYEFVRNDKIIRFDVDGQGLSGGQHWELVYAVDGTLYGNTGSFRNQKPGKDNVVKGEPLGGNWWYLWTDYDDTELTEN